MTTPCPICRTEIDQREILYADENCFFYPCPSCGNFTIYRTLIAALPEIIQMHKDAGPKIIRAIKEQNEKGEIYYLDREVLRKLLFEL